MGELGDHGERHGDTNTVADSIPCEDGRGGPPGRALLFDWELQSMLVQPLRRCTHCCRRKKDRCRDIEIFLKLVFFSFVEFCVLLLVCTASLAGWIIQV